MANSFINRKIWRKLPGLFAAVIVVLSLAACSAGGAGANSPAGGAGENDSAGGAGANASPAVAERSFFAMDTYMSVKAYGVDDAVLSDIEAEVGRLEGLWSVTKEDSEISKLNKEKRAEISADTGQIMSFALEMCKETKGALDISIYPILKAWGFTTGEYKVPDKKEIDELLHNVDYSRVELEDGTAHIPEGFEVDLGSVGKGYTGDHIINMLKEAGASSALLDLGGNVQTLGKKPDGSDWKVGIQNPDGNGYFGIISVSDTAVITSGGYERYFEDDDGNIWWHIIDPATGYPAKNGLVSVSVISEKGAYCDSLSTALFVMGEEKAITFWKEHNDFDMILVTDDGRLLYTDGISDTFELADEKDFSEITVIK